MTEGQTPPPADTLREILDVLVWFKEKYEERDGGKEPEESILAPVVEPEPKPGRRRTMPDKTWNTREAGKYLRCSSSHVGTLIARGDIYGVKGRGNHWVIDPESVKDYKLQMWGPDPDEAGQY